MNVQTAINRIKQARTRLQSNISAILTQERDQVTPKGARLAASTSRPGQFTISARGSTKGGEDNRKDSRNNSSGPSRRNPALGKSSQLVQKVTSRSFDSSRHVYSAPGSKQLFLSEQHELDPPVAYASSTSELPAGFKMSEQSVDTKYGPGIRLSGREYITNITTTGATGRGECLFSLPISPTIIQDTRLALFSSMYTRYIFKRFRLSYHGTAPTTQSGSLTFFGDYDPTQNPMASVGDSALRYAYTHESQDFSVWQSATCEVNDKPYAEMLYTDPSTELRWSVQGNFWVLSSGALPATTECGKIVLDYEIDFAVPDYRGAILSPSAGSQTFTIPITALGAGITLSGALPSTGVYFLRVDTVPSSSVTMATSFTAYDMAAPYVPLQKGTGLWMYVKSTGSIAYLLWSPCFYDRSMQVNSCVAAIAISAPVTFTGVFYGYAPVSND
jgi:hypothetical protein